MKILLTGSNGQLGNEIQQLAASYPDYQFIYTDLAELNITNEQAVDSFFNSSRPDVLINCAAYTAVDKAESDKETAFLVNATATGILARTCSKYQVLMVHISTDYVFGGTSYKPLKEDDPTNPSSEYAISKLAGEEQIKTFASKGIIIRTSWLYSVFGNNFVKTMIKYGLERGTLNVVCDQIGTPTYAGDLSKLILDILPLAIENQGIEVFHYSNEGVTSWYDFAIAIIELSSISCKVNPIASKDYPTPAPRPFYSVLDKSKIKETYSIEIPYWRESLKVCLHKLNVMSKTQR